MERNNYGFPVPLYGKDGFPKTNEYLFPIYRSLYTRYKGLENCF